MENLFTFVCKMKYKNDVNVFTLECKELVKHKGWGQIIFYETGRTCKICHTSFRIECGRQ